MGRKFLVILTAVLFLAGVSVPLFAAVDVGNKICPVTGDKIDPKSNFTYEYKGKVYHFCCPMCVPEFKNNPAKYIEKIKEEKGENG